MENYVNNDCNNDKKISDNDNSIESLKVETQEFQHLNLIELRKLAIEELVKYYSEFRKYEYKNGKRLEGINLRKKIHFLISAILKIDQLMSKEKIHIINDLHNSNNNRPKIYACTHIGGNDIQRSFQVIKDPAYLMLGDPGILYRKFIYLGLKMNGVIPLETTDKEDRKIAYNRAIELLNNGGNLLIYPEGAWNVSPNLVVMKIFNGTVRMAKETGAEIIPIAIEQYGNDFYFNIGENYTIPNDTTKSITELNNELRDKLATLKWDIICCQPELSRDSISDDYLQEFQDEIVNRCNYGYGFSLEDAISESFHDKNIATEEDVFSFLCNLDIGKHNAFLAKDKMKFKQKIKSKTK